MSEQIKDNKVSVPDGLWLRCGNCRELIFQKEFLRNLKVCPKCSFHYKLSAKERINYLLDGGSFKELFSNIESSDHLNFIGKKPYTRSIQEAKEKSSLTEAAVVGTATLSSNPIAFGVLDFSFIGGSMGSVVGEKITRITEFATSETLPLIISCASGGARMQEGILSLMQMAKCSAAVGKHLDAGLPYLSILTDPTTGGVTASFATLADVIIAEPGALIGFTGPRVIEQTTKQRLPKGFQSSEFQKEHGMVDMVVSRLDLRLVLAKLIAYLSGSK